MRLIGTSPQRADNALASVTGITHMRTVIFGVGVVVAGGVFVTMLLSILSARGTGEGDDSFRQSVFEEIVWALIPCLMIVAAVVPAAIAIVGEQVAH